MAVDNIERTISLLLNINIENFHHLAIKFMFKKSIEYLIKIEDYERCSILKEKEKKYLKFLINKN